MCLVLFGNDCLAPLPAPTSADPCVTCAPCGKCVDYVLLMIKMDLLLEFRIFWRSVFSFMQFSQVPYLSSLYVRNGIALIFFILRLFNLHVLSLSVSVPERLSCCLASLANRDC